jgi:hypothetical protein
MDEKQMELFEQETRERVGQSPLGRLSKSDYLNKLAQQSLDLICEDSKGAPDASD